MRRTRAWPPTGLIPWFSKTEGNTYATLLHHPFLFEENQHNAKRGSNIQHTVHSDELFVIRQHKRNGQPDQGVCDIRHAVHSDELFALR